MWDHFADKQISGLIGKLSRTYLTPMPADRTFFFFFKIRSLCRSRNGRPVLVLEWYAHRAWARLFVSTQQEKLGTILAKSLKRSGLSAAVMNPANGVADGMGRLIFTSIPITMKGPFQNRRGKGTSPVRSEDSTANDENCGKNIYFLIITAKMINNHHKRINKLDLWSANNLIMLWFQKIVWNILL